MSSRHLSAFSHSHPTKHVVTIGKINSLHTLQGKKEGQASNGIRTAIESTSLQQSSIALYVLSKAHNYNNRHRTDTCYAMLKFRYHSKADVGN